MHNASAQDGKMKDAVTVRVPLVHEVCLRRRARAIPVDPIACWSGKNTASASQPITMYRETETARIRLCTRISWRIPTTASVQTIPKSTYPQAPPQADERERCVGAGDQDVDAGPRQVSLVSGSPDPPL